MKVYPINLIGLQNHLTLVIGGGKVAARKVTGLLEAGAQVKVISPAVEPEIADLVRQGRLLWDARPYHPGDLAGAFVVISATDDPEVNQAVWQEAQLMGCLINVCDDPERSNFIAPAVVRRGELVVTVSTGGASPALARHLRETLETCYGPEYAEFVTLLGDLRPELLRLFPPGQARQQAAMHLVSSDVLEVLRAQGYAAAHSRARQFLQALVAGPAADSAE